MNNPDPQTTLINLPNSREARAFGPGENFWDEDMDRMRGLISDHLASLYSQEDSHHQDDASKAISAKARDEPSLGLAVFGPSGSGKSSFLATFTTQQNLQKIGGKRRVVSLPTINPMRFSEDDHFLYAVLAGALHLHEKDNRRKSQRDGRNDDDFLALSMVNRSFNEVSRHLQVVDPPAPVKEYDPVGYSMERLHRHTSAHQLKSALEIFINELAKELCGDSNGVLVLPVDDADLSVDKLEHVLTTYRNYLMHPRLIPIFTFTDKLGEELLREHFQKSLISETKSGLKRSERPENLTLAEQLSLHYLSRLFPVRNRVRLGFVPSRATVSEYRNGEKGEQPVIELLRTASYLLFGYPDRTNHQKMRAMLRPATLRRQIQIIDAMAGAGVERYVCEAINEIDQPRVSEQLGNTARKTAAPSSAQCQGSGQPQWPKVFERSSWSLLNVHRDALRELDLHMEHLHSWSRSQLRSFILQTIMDQDLRVRRTLLERWRGHERDRRSDAISLLAATVFRPWMTGDPQPAGDEPTEQLVVRYNGADSETALNDYEILLTDGLLWFLNLVIGFYEPQMLARNRVLENPVRKPESLTERSGPIFDYEGILRGVGWNLRFGPINAMRIADTNQDIFASGMIFVDPLAFSRQLRWVTEFRTAAKRKSENVPQEVLRDLSDDELILRIWSGYGYRSGRFWAVVSLWRGLGLLGEILEIQKTWNIDKKEWSKQIGKMKVNSQSELDKLGLDDRLNRAIRDICSIIRHHSTTGGVPRSFLGEDAKKKYLYIAFRSPRSMDLRDASVRMAVAIVEWLLESVVDKGINVVPFGDKKLKWRRSFIRRLHGDSIVGRFLSQITANVLEEQHGDDHDPGNPSHLRWDACLAIRGWLRTLIDYWNCCSSEDVQCKNNSRNPEHNESTQDDFSCNQAARALWTCPFIMPFVDIRKVDDEKSDDLTKSFCHHVETTWDKPPFVPPTPAYLQFFDQELEEKQRYVEGKLKDIKIDLERVKAGQDQSADEVDLHISLFPGRRWDEDLEFRHNYTEEELRYLKQVSAFESKFQEHLPQLFENFVELSSEKLNMDSSSLRINALFREIPRVSWDYFRARHPSGRRRIQLKSSDEKAPPGESCGGEKRGGEDEPKPAGS